MYLFGLVFLFVFFLIISIILFILKLIFKKKIFNLLNIAWWIFFISIPFLLTIISFFTSKKEVEKEDIYGEYVIDREKYAGKQADWQYNHYRFKITDDNKIIFYITEKENIVKTIEGKVEFTEYSHSPHIKIDLQNYHHQHLSENNLALFFSLRISYFAIFPAYSEIQVVNRV